MLSAKTAKLTCWADVSKWICNFLHYATA